MQSILAPAASTLSISTWVELVNTEISTWVDVLINDGAVRLLQRSEMDKVVDLIELLPDSLVASEQPGLGADRIGSVLGSFYTSLVSTGSSPVDRLTDPDVREVARNLCARRVSSYYELVLEYSIVICLFLLTYLFILRCTLLYVTIKISMTTEPRSSRTHPKR